MRVIATSRCAVVGEREPSSTQERSSGQPPLDIACRAAEAHRAATERTTAPGGRRSKHRERRGAVGGGGGFQLAEGSARRTLRLGREDLQQGRLDPVGVGGTELAPVRPDATAQQHRRQLPDVGGLRLGEAGQQVEHKGRRAERRREGLLGLPDLLGVALNHLREQRLELRGRHQPAAEVERRRHPGCCEYRLLAGGLVAGENRPRFTFFTGFRLLPG